MANEAFQGLRTITIGFQNCTDEELRDLGVMFPHEGHMWPKRPPPKTIPPRKSAQWVATSSTDVDAGVGGSMWYTIGKDGAQINIDFDNYKSKANNFKVYTNNGDKYFVFYEHNGANARSAQLMVRLGYDYKDKEVSGAWLHDSPACVVYSKNNTLFCFFHGDNPEQTLWSKAFDGQHWGKEQEAVTKDNRRMWMKASPAVANFRGLIYCFFQGGRNDELWGATFDGTSWLDLWQLGNSRLTSSPATVVFQNKLHCLWQGAGDAGTLWHRTLDVADGAKWSDEKQIRGDRIMSEAPSAIVWKDKLYVFFQGANHDGSLKHLVFDGNTWTGPVEVQKIGMSRSPALAIVKDKIRIYHQSYKETGQLWSMDFGGEAEDFPVVCVGLSDSPAVACYGDGIVCLHKGTNPNLRLYSCFLPLNH